MGCGFGPALADLRQKLLFVFAHELDQGLIFGFFVGRGPKDHLGEDRSEIEPFGGERVKQLSPIGRMGFRRDDSVGL